MQYGDKKKTSKLEGNIVLMEDRTSRILIESKIAKDLKDSINTNTIILYMIFQK